MSCEKCEKINDHDVSVKKNYDKMQKENVQLHAQVSHYKDEYEKFKVAAKDKLKKIIGMYDSSADKMLGYFVENKMIHKCEATSEHSCPWLMGKTGEVCIYHQVEQLKPMRLN